MPFLKQQVTIVNNWLKATGLKPEVFAKSRIEAIAVDCSRTETDGSISYFPAVMDDNNEAQAIVVDDTYGLIIYHKIIGNAYSLNPQQFGDREKLQVQTTRIKMVVYAKYSIVKLKKEELEALIAVNFPDKIPASLSDPLKLDDLDVTLQNSNMVSAQVWQEEYRGTPLRLAPEDVYFSMIYDLTSTYRKGCFQLCNCENYLLTENGIPIKTETGTKIKV